MVSPVILAKENSKLPDFFGMKVIYITGKTEEFQVAERGPVMDGLMSFVDKDDIWHLLVMSSVLRIEYDKNYSALVAIREEEKAKENAKSNA